MIISCTVALYKSDVVVAEREKKKSKFFRYLLPAHARTHTCLVAESFVRPSSHNNNMIYYFNDVRAIR